jgi:putative flippase GtrA
MKVGVIGVLLSWVILCLWALLSLIRSPEGTSQNPAYADGTTVSFLFMFVAIEYPD